MEAWGFGEVESSMRKAIALILEALLGLFMVYIASTFVSTPEIVAKARAALNYPQWYWQLAGVVSAISAITLLLGLFIRIVGAFGALWLTANLIGATVTH